MSDPGAYGPPPTGAPRMPGPTLAAPVRAATPTEPLAIAALVCGLLGLVTFVTAPVAFVLGLVALSRIKRTTNGGRGLAIAGVVIGATVTVAYVVFVVALTVALHRHPSCSYVASNNPGNESFQQCVDNGTYRTGG